MTADERARALIQEINLGDCWEDPEHVAEIAIAKKHLLAYGREERRRVWEQVDQAVTDVINQHKATFSPGYKRGVHEGLKLLQRWCRQQACEEETR